MLENTAAVVCRLWDDYSGNTPLFEVRICALQDMLQDLLGSVVRAKLPCALLPFLCQKKCLDSTTFLKPGSRHSKSVQTCLQGIVGH